MYEMLKNKWNDNNKVTDVIYSVKNPVNRVRIEITYWKKIFVNHILNKELVPKHYDII